MTDAPMLDQSPRWARLARFAVVALLALAGTHPLGAQNAARGGYHIVARYTVGGDGGWDYVTVDTARSRIFVTRGDRVMVIDQATGKLLGEIPGLNRAHGVALDYSTNHGFATSGGDSTVI